MCGMQHRQRAHLENEMGEKYEESEGKKNPSEWRFNQKASSMNHLI